MAKNNGSGKATIREVYDLLQKLRQEIVGDIKKGDESLWTEIKALREIAESNKSGIAGMKGWAAGAGAIVAAAISCIFKLIDK